MHESSLKEIQKEWHGSYKAYFFGFILSLFLTLLSFYLVYTQALPETSLIYILIGLALAQAVVQLLFFLHLGQESNPRWETLIFLFMVLILIIIAFGSIWIMNDLNSRMMMDM